MLEDAGAAEGQGPTDEELIDATRGGNVEAYGELWVRHERAASSVASKLSANGDDLVAEAFIRVLRALRAGSAPITNFRAYVCSAVRTCAVDEHRRSSRSIATCRLDLIGEAAVPAEDGSPTSDDALAAWQSLSKRDQWIMWAYAVQGYSTTEMAEQLGARPGTVAVWTYRAREKLRAAFLVRQITAADNAICQGERDRFVAYVRGRLSARRRSEVEAHLDACPACALVLTSVTNVNERFRGAVWPLVPAVGGMTLAGVGHASHGLLRHLAHLVPAKMSSAVAATGAVSVGVASVVVVAVVHTNGHHSAPLPPQAAPPLTHRTLEVAPRVIRHQAARPATVVRSTPTPPAAAVALPVAQHPQASTVLHAIPVASPAPHTPTPTPTPAVVATPMTVSNRSATSTFAIVVPDPSNTNGTVTVSLPSGWTATGVALRGLASTGGVGTRFDGSNTVTLTFTNLQVDPNTSTIELTVSGSGLYSGTEVATASESLSGAAPATQTSALQ